MPRLRNELTGAVMTVEESTAVNLGAEWVPADAEESAKPRSSRSRKSE